LLGGVNDTVTGIPRCGTFGGTAYSGAARGPQDPGGAAVASGDDQSEAVLYGAGTLFEVLFGLWLTIKGIDVERWRAPAASRPVS
jgi:hypothetical protein